jgi:DNA-directed RNA polymerase subunit M/transcription elongation factor TFIIS
MDEWTKFSDDILSSIIHKEDNRKNVIKALWRYGNEDFFEAKYLLYEIFVEYLINFRINDVFHKLRDKSIGWDHVEFNPIKSKFNEYDNFLTSPPEVEEGVIECRKCNSKRTFSFSKQTRRADESATVFVRCASCNSTFRL